METKDKIDIELEAIPTELRTCKKCHRIRPITDYKTYKGGKHSWICNDCAGISDRFKDIKSCDLIQELRNRGYKGKLSYTTIKEVVI